jgi:hypothetical protein
VLRDDTKSMKHYWHEATLIPNLADLDAAWRVACRFLELRADDVAGGFVPRRFEQFTSAEARSWWINGACRLIGAHPDTPHEQPPAGLDLSWLKSAVAGLRLPFVTVDLALRADGIRRVAELGDGQVSDHPTTLAPQALIAAVADLTLGDQSPGGGTVSLQFPDEVYSAQDTGADELTGFLHQPGACSQACGFLRARVRVGAHVIPSCSGLPLT